MLSEGWINSEVSVMGWSGGERHKVSKSVFYVVPAWQGLWFRPGKLLDVTNGFKEMISNLFFFSSLRQQSLTVFWVSEYHTLLHTHTHTAESFLLSLELAAQPSKAATQIWPGVDVGWWVGGLCNGLFSLDHMACGYQVYSFLSVSFKLRGLDPILTREINTQTLGSNDDKMVTYEVIP